MISFGDDRFPPPGRKGRGGGEGEGGLQAAQPLLAATGYAGGDILRVHVPPFIWTVIQTRSRLCAQDRDELHRQPHHNQNHGDVHGVGRACPWLSHPNRAGAALLFWYLPQSLFHVTPTATPGDLSRVGKRPVSEQNDAGILVLRCGGGAG